MSKASLLLVLAGFVAIPAFGQDSVTQKQTEVMSKLLIVYTEQAKEEAAKKKFKEPKLPFSAEVGREFYLKRRTWQSTDYTCSGCHTEDPKKTGKHIETGKSIKPLAPVANPERFTDVKKVEKNFTEHCMDFHDRDCFAHEKGHFIAYLMSVK